MSVPSPALWPELVSLNRFPLVSPLSSTFSADYGAPQSLFEGFTGTMKLSDFPQPFIAVVLLRFTARTSLCHPTRPVRGISRFSCIECPRMLRVSDSAGPVHNSLNNAATPSCLPHRCTRSAPRKGDFGAQWLACASPCQRFTCNLTVARA
jgi:hypothetical protein